MATQHSTIPAVKAALAAQLAVRSNLSGVQISYGAPIPDPHAEFIWIGNAEGEISSATMRPDTLPKNEKYTLSVIVSVLQQTTNQQTVTERAFALANEVHDQLQSDPKINNTAGLIYAIVSGRFALVENADDRQREAILRIPVYCFARL